MPARSLPTASGPADPRRRATHPADSPPLPVAPPASADRAAGPDSTAPDPAPLVARAAAGDDDAWAELVARYARRVYALAKSRLRSPELAEEVTQAVFVTLVRTLRATGDAADDISQPAPARPARASARYAERGAFEPWLFRIAMNRIRDEARRAKRQATPTDPAVVAAAGDAARADDTANADGPALGDSPGPDPREAAALQRAMARLSDADRRIIDLRHHAQMAFKDIAALLDAPLGTVLARHHRALAKLRGWIDQDLGPPATDS